MTREMFDRELHRLQDELIVMAGMVEDAIRTSVETLKVRNFEGSKKVIAQDNVINKKRYTIEADCLTAIATQQPMAIDLRLLAAILDITKELERIGDYAKGIARINLMIGAEPLIKPLIDIPRMAEKVCDMLHRAIDAFIQRDTTLATSIPKEDDEVDQLYDQIYRELITHLLASPSKIKQANFLLWVAHNLERAADRVINICERVVFTVTGEILEISTDESGIESL